ncbi:uncharacterized protein HD556DRAFT_1449342 [Suillus plorans]|uniref:Uncharacterized protein n=1 Tax=Suillus plorans TaxID=116603 RepID=A0A9P7DB39_9AGAM|nr:uncharacterized protein HD556DRAFT_1449342 [Suillus plorans]KAG1786847.1 hypothetical protein HD556DRAFT_1449342 [Suillus plorans]
MTSYILHSGGKTQAHTSDPWTQAHTSDPILHSGGKTQARTSDPQSPSTSFGASPSPTHFSATPFASAHDVPPPTIGPFPHVAITPSTGAHYAPPGALGSPSQVAGTKRHFAASPAPAPPTV